MPGAVTTVGVVAVVASVCVGVATVGGAAVEAQRVAGIADAAALAAADAASGAIPGVPCERAGRVAAAAGVHVGACDLDGLVATVAVVGTYGPLSFDARARAGPPTQARG